MNYENRTVYTEELYREILNNKSFTYEILVFKGLIISGMMWMAARAVQQDNRSVYNWIFCAIAVILVPFLLIGYPLIRNRRAYGKAMKITGGKQIITDAVLSPSDITVRNSMGEKLVRKYEDVTEVRKTKSLLIILSRKFNPIYLDLNGFRKCTTEEAIAFLKKKCPKARFN